MNLQNLSSISRVLFLLPGPYVYEDRCQTYIGWGSFFGYREPVEEMYAAGALERLGKVCHIIHAAPRNLSAKQITEEILGFRPDVTVISTTYPSCHDDLVWANIIKKHFPESVVIARGGQMAFVNRKRILDRHPHVDIITRGETESVLYGLFSTDEPKGLTYTQNNRIEETPRLSDFKEPGFFGNCARHLLDSFAYRSPNMGGPMASIWANRGCDNQCSFCLSPALYGKSIKFRTVDSVTEEIVQSHEKYGIRDFFMRGETFTANHKWVSSLCENLDRYAPWIRWVANARADTVDNDLICAMKRAGCWGLAIGAETGSENTMRRIGKKLTQADIYQAVRACRKNRIMSLAYFLIGFPWEKQEDILATIKFASQLKADVSEYFFPYPFPGTALYPMAKARDLLSEESPPGLPQQYPVFVPEDMTRKQLIRWRQKARANPFQIFRSSISFLRHAQNPTDFFKMALQGIAIGRKSLTIRRSVGMFTKENP